MTKRMIAFALLTLASIGIAMPAQAGCNDGKDRTITVTNKSRFVVTEVRASNTRNDEWGPNRLSGTIHQWESRTIDMDDGSCRCLMDLYAKASDGSTWDRRGYNVCSRDGWNLLN